MNITKLIVDSGYMTRAGIAHYLDKHWSQVQAWYLGKFRPNAENREYLVQLYNKLKRGRK